MTDGVATQSRTGIGEDWQVGLALWIAPSTVVVYVAFWMSDVIARTQGVQGGSGVVIGRWILSSAAHIEWTAPALIAAAFALAAICAAPIHERPGHGSAVRIFALAASSISVALSVWIFFAAFTIGALDALEKENPDARAQFAAVSGIFLSAPVGIVVGLSAGRFQLISATQRLHNARAWAAELDIEISHLRASVPAEIADQKRLQLRYRLMRYALPLVLGILAVVATAVVATNVSLAAPVIVGYPVFSVIVFLLSAVCSAAAASMISSPSQSVMRDGQPGHGLNRLGSIAFGMLLLGAIFPIGVAALLSASISGVDMTTNEQRLVWITVLGPLIAAAIYAIALVHPGVVRGSRQATLARREKARDRAQESIARLEADLAQDVARPATRASAS